MKIDSAYRKVKEQSGYSYNVETPILEKIHTENFNQNSPLMNLPLLISEVNNILSEPAKEVTYTKDGQRRYIAKDDCGCYIM